MSISKKVSGTLLGNFSMPLPSPYVVYFLALVAGVGALVFSAQMIAFAYESAQLDVKLERNKQIIYDIPKLEEQHADLSAKVRVEENDLANKVTLRNSAEKEFSEIKKKQQDLDGIVTQLRREESELRRSKNELDISIKGLQGEEDKLRLRIGRLTADTEEKEKVQKEVSSLVENRTKLEADIAVLTMKRDSLKSLQEKLEVDTSDLRKATDETTKVVQEFSKSASSLDSQLRTISGQSVTLQQNVKSLEEPATSLKASSDDIKVALPELNNFLTKSIPALEKRLAELSDKKSTEVTILLKEISGALGDLRKGASSTDSGITKAELQGLSEKVENQDQQLKKLYDLLDSRLPAKSLGASSSPPIVGSDPSVTPGNMTAEGGKQQ